MRSQWAPLTFVGEFVESLLGSLLFVDVNNLFSSCVCWISDKPARFFFVMWLHLQEKAGRQPTYHRFHIKVNRTERRWAPDPGWNTMLALEVWLKSQVGTWRFAQLAFESRCFEYYIHSFEKPPIVWKVEPNSKFRLDFWHVWTVELNSRRDVAASYFDSRVQFYPKAIISNTHCLYRNTKLHQFIL